MKLKRKLIAMVLCAGILVPNVFLTALAEYSTVIPDALMCEVYNYTTNGGIFGGGKSKWTVYDATVTGKTASMADAKIEKLPKDYVNSIIGSVPTTSVLGGSGIYVGRFQNSQNITLYTVKSDDEYSSTGGAAKFMLDNTDIEADQDYTSIIGNFKANYYTNRNGISWLGKGANSNVEVVNTDITGYSKDAYVVVGLQAEENADLESTYISLASWNVKNAQGTTLTDNKYRAVTGVPISRYYDETDKGTYREIAIPLSDFDTSNEWVQGKLALNAVPRPDGFPDDYKVPVNLKNFLGMGIMKLWSDYTPESDYAIYVTKFQIVQFNSPVSDLKLEKEDSENALSWSVPLNNSISHYQIASINGNDTKSYYVSADELVQKSGKYFWYIPEDTEAGSLFKVSAVAGKLVGNEDVGYFPIYSDYSQCKSGTSVTAVKESLDVSLAGKGMESNSFDLTDNMHMYGVSYGEHFNDGYADISDLKDKAYAVFEFDADGIDVSNFYFTIGSSTFDGLNRKYILSSVCAADYIESTDGHTTVRIPLSDFSGDSAVINVYDDKTGALETNGEKFDYSKFSTMGFVKSKDVEINADKLLIVDYDVEQNAEVTDATDKSVSLQWNEPKSLINEYTIYRNGEEIAKLDGKAASFTDTPALGFEFDKEYTYVIAANAECGMNFESEPLSVIIPRLDMPRDFSVNSVYTNKAEPAIMLKWNTPKFGDNIRTGYEIYRNDERIATVENDRLSYIDTDVSYGENYQYFIRSIGYENGEMISSLDTQTMSAYAVCLSNPENLSVTVSGTNINLNWDNVEYASEYEVYIDDVLQKKTSYTNVTMPAGKLNTYFDVAVIAVNEAGVKSFKSVCKKIFVPDPLLENDSEIIYDDSFTKSLSTVNNAVYTERDTNVYISGAASALIDFSDVIKSSGSINIAYSLDAQKMRDDDKRLTMQLLVDNPDMLENISVGLGMNAKVNNKNTTVWADVNLSDYASDNTKWQYVSIPFIDFPETGVYISEAKENRLSMNYSNINSIRIVCNNKYNKPAIIHIDDFKIEGYKDWRIADIIRDTAGNIIDKNNVGAIDGMRILFDMAMNPESLNSTTVTVEDNDGNMLSTYGQYNSEEHAYKIYLAEPLKSQSNYTLKICAKSEVSNKELSVSVPLKTGVFDEYTITGDNVPFGYNITGSVSGSNATVTFRPNVSQQCIADSINMVISYNSNVLSIKSDEELFKDIDGNALVTSEEGKLTVDIKLNKSLNLSNYTFAVPFKIIKDGNSKITVNGESVLVNSPMAVINSSADLSFKIEDGSNDKKDSGGGGSGSKTSASRPGGYVSDSQVDNKKSFSDLQGFEWARESIENLASQNIINGYEDGTFRPEAGITREEFSKLLVVFCGIEDDSSEMNFDDVLPGSWYEKYVCSAAKYGLVKGIGNNEFGTGKFITREDMCVMLERAIEQLKINVNYIYDEIPFDDYSEVSDYAKDSVRNMFRCGYINGIGNNKFDGKGNVTRAMAAKVLNAIYLASNI